MVGVVLALGAKLETTCARGRFMPGVSGNPLGQIKGKRLTALCTELASDFGGEDQLTAAGRLLLEQAEMQATVSRDVTSAKPKTGHVVALS
jgi:hypothetical protein